MTIKTWAFALMAVVTGWLATLMLVMALTDAAPGAIVLFPASDFTTRLAESAAIVGVGPFWIAIKSDAPGLGLALYRSGGRIVLPAGLPGCLPLPGAS
jgi:hypothetical protein